MSLLCSWIVRATFSNPARRVQSDEALALGIFNQVVADEDFLTETMNLPKHIASGPPIALGYMKENINAATGCDLRTSLNMEADRLIRCAFTQDHKEAVTAFMAKRAPVFSGK